MAKKAKHVKRVGPGRPRKVLDPHDPRARFGAALVALREAAGLTAPEAAVQFGVGRATWYDWETGRRVPDLFQLRRIARLLKCSVEALIPE